MAGVGVTAATRCERPPPQHLLLRDMIWIPGGTFRVGPDAHYPEEAPVHCVSVDTSRVGFRCVVREGSKS
jgi:formylglycine-generating enzyme required for sulfatase activity